MNPHPTKQARNVQTWLRIGWFLFLLTSALGLKNHTIQNSLSDWMPNLASASTTSTYLVIATDNPAFDPTSVATSLETLDVVARCIVPPADPDAPASYAGLFCFAQPNIDAVDFNSDVRQHLHAQFPQIDSHLHIAGPAAFTSALNDYSQRGLPITMLLIMAIGAITLACITRSIRATAQSLIAIFTSQIAIVGAISWTHQPMNMMLSMIPPLMMALGFSFAAHRALRSNITRTLIYCALTTALGFLGFALADTPLIRVFALWSAFGVILQCFAVIACVKPVAQTPHTQPNPQINTRPWPPTRYRKTIITLAAGISLYALTLPNQLNFESNPINYFPDDAPIALDSHALDQNFTGMLPFQIQLDTPADPTILIEQTPAIRLLVNASQWLPDAQNTWVGAANSDSLKQLVDAQPDWQNWADQNNTRLTWKGVAAQLHAIQSMVRDIAIMAFPAMVLISGIAVWLTTKNLRIALVGAWVNFFPVAILLVIAVATDYPLGLPALMIGAVAVGVAVDDTLHITRALTRHANVADTMRQCVKPCLSSSIIAALCMIMFLACPFKPTAQFGLMMAAAILAALVGDLILLPCLLPQTDYKSESSDCK